jgi:hypothetical protein
MQDNNWDAFVRAAESLDETANNPGSNGEQIKTCFYCCVGRLNKVLRGNNTDVSVRAASYGLFNRIQMKHRQKIISSLGN